MPPRESNVIAFDAGGHSVKPEVPSHRIAILSINELRMSEEPGNYEFSPAGTGRRRIRRGTISSCPLRDWIFLSQPTQD